MMHTKLFILPLAMLLTLPWNSAFALTINLNDNRERPVEHRRDERAREARRDEQRRDDRRMRRDDDSNSVRRFFKRVNRDGNSSHRQR